MPCQQPTSLPSLLLQDLLVWETEAASMICSSSMDRTVVRHHQIMLQLHFLTTTKRLWSCFSDFSCAARQMWVEPRKGMLANLVLFCHAIVCRLVYAFCCLSFSSGGSVIQILSNLSSFLMCMMN
jgi:hypothetical protein